MARQCPMCFQFKDPLFPILPKAPTVVCKACSYKIQAVIGFLMYHGIKLSYQPAMDEQSPEATLTPAQEFEASLVEPEKPPAQKRDRRKLQDIPQHLKSGKAPQIFI